MNEDIAIRLLGHINSVDSLFDSMKRAELIAMQEAYTADDLDVARGHQGNIEILIDQKKSFHEGSLKIRTFASSFLPKQEVAKLQKEAEETILEFPAKELFVQALIDTLYASPNKRLSGWIAQRLTIVRVLSTLDRDSATAVLAHPDWAAYSAKTASWACGHLRRESQKLIELPGHNGTATNVWALTERGITVGEKRVELSGESTISTEPESTFLPIRDVVNQTGLSQWAVRNILRQEPFRSQVVLGEDPGQRVAGKIMLVPQSLLNDIVSQYA